MCLALLRFYKQQSSNQPHEAGTVISPTLQSTEIAWISSQSLWTVSQDLQPANQLQSRHLTTIYYVASLYKDTQYGDASQSEDLETNTNRRMVADCTMTHPFIKLTLSSIKIFVKNYGHWLKLVIYYTRKNRLQNMYTVPIFKMHIKTRITIVT